MKLIINIVSIAFALQQSDPKTACNTSTGQHTYAVEENSSSDEGAKPREGNSLRDKEQ